MNWVFSNLCRQVKLQELKSFYDFSKQYSIFAYIKFLYFRKHVYDIWKYQYTKIVLHGKNAEISKFFAKIPKNLARYRSENNLVRPSK